ncbi:MAG: four helix bundle protein [Bacteroidales bacterium]|nr:four helix bundle protein [Bacteroidales bacterium]
MGEIKKARNFREYKVWQDAVAFASEVYKVTAEMPWFEKKGLCDQLQRAVVSISSNIAEGAAKPSDTEFAHFLDMALGSAFEVETQILIAKNIGYIKNANDEDNGGVTYEALLSELHDIEKQLNGLINSVRNSYR